MRILADGNVYFLNDNLYEAPRPADDWLGRPRGLSTKPGMRCSRSARRKRLELHLAKNFLRRMPSNTINSYRKSEEIVRKKGPVRWTRGLETFVPRSLDGGSEKIADGSRYPRDG
jgi:hypothetical protein